MRSALILLLLFTFTLTKAQEKFDTSFKKRVIDFFNAIDYSSDYGQHKRALFNSYGVNPIIVRQSLMVDKDFSRIEIPKRRSRKLYKTREEGTHHGMRVYNIDSIVLTGREWQQIAKHLKNMPDHNWDDDYFPNTTFINRATADSVRDGLKPAGPFSNWEMFPYGYFEFSVPLFLRDNSIALLSWWYTSFNWTTYSGGGWRDEHGAAVYVLRNGIWTEFRTLHAFDFHFR